MIVSSILFFSFPSFAHLWSTVVIPDARLLLSLNIVLNPLILLSVAYIRKLSLQFVAFTLEMSQILINAFFTILFVNLNRSTASILGGNLSSQIIVLFICCIIIIRENLSSSNHIKNDTACKAQELRISSILKFSYRLNFISLLTH